MQAGREVKLRRGAIWACAIPMALGLINILFLVFNPPQDEGVLLAFSIMVGLYFTVVLICIPPLAAFLTGLRLRRINDSYKLKQWRTCFQWGLLNATLIHFLITIIFTVFFVGVSHHIYLKSVFNPLELRRLGILHFEASVFISLKTWIFLTLPLTAIGATIFDRITKFPSDRTVF